MRLLIPIYAIALLLFAASPAVAGPCVDDDMDGVCDAADNCIPPNLFGSANPAQDDTDGDLCGNVCDPDFDQNGIVGFPDIIEVIGCFPPAICTFSRDVTEPIGNEIGFPDIIKVINYFGLPPGPSGITPGTVACP